MNIRLNNHSPLDSYRLVDESVVKDANTELRGKENHLGTSGADGHIALAATIGQVLLLPPSLNPAPQDRDNSFQNTIRSLFEPEIAEKMLKEVNLEISQNPDSKLNGLIKLTQYGIDLTNKDFKGYPLGIFDFSNCDLRGADFSVDLDIKRKLNSEKGSNDFLEGTIFNNANISGAKFADAGLKGASLLNVTAEGANFHGVDLSETKISGDFSKTDFSASYLIYSEFNPVNIQGADFSGADIRGAIIPDLVSDYIHQNNQKVFRESLNVVTEDTARKIAEIQTKVSDKAYDSKDEPLLALIQDLFENHSGIAFGENHSDVLHLRKLAELMPELKTVGLEILALEINHGLKPDLEKFIKADAGSLDESSNLAVFLDKRWGKDSKKKEFKYHEPRLAMEELLIAAKRNNVKIILADSDDSLKDKETGLNRRHVDNQAKWCGIRQAESEPFAEQVIRKALEESTPSAKFLAIFGWGHVSPDARCTDAETPNIYSRLDIPTVAIQKNPDTSALKTVIEVGGEQAVSGIDMDKTLDFRVFLAA
jgi:uncharacterized protein YjbI with pentapeptide repeats